MEITKIDNSTKKTISNGWGATKEQNKMLTKELIKTLIHTGVGLSKRKSTNLSKICTAANISRKTLYNYMNEDKQFERQVRSGMMIDLQTQAAMNVMDKLNEGDYVASRNYLKDTGYYGIPGKTDNSLTLEKDSSGIYKMPDSLEDLTGDILLSLNGEYVDSELDKVEDKLSEALRMKDEETKIRLQELRDKENNV